MDKSLLTKEKQRFENLFYNQITPVLNKMSGLGVRDQFSVGMFLKLGVKFEWYHNPEASEVKPTRTVAEKIQLLLSRMSAYVEFSGQGFEKNSAVVIKIGVKDEDDLTLMSNLLQDKNIYSFLAFVYLHEVQHILRKHNTRPFASLMTSVVIKEKGSDWLEGLGKNNLHKLFNFAEDYAINFALIELLSNSTNENASHAKNIQESGLLYNMKYAGMSEIEILKKLLKDDEIFKYINNPGAQGAGKDGRLGKSIEGDEYSKGDEKEASKASELDKEMDSLGESLQKNIDKQAGKDGFLLNKVIDNSIKVDVRWFEKLQQGLYTFINKKTKHSVATWSNLDNKLRHIYKSPRRRNIEKTIDLVVSVDQSGSISYESLGKLLYLFEEKASSINSIDLVFHDTKVVHVDSFSGNFNSKKIIESVKNRHCGGGTSHSDVFRWLDENFSSRDVSRKIYISFSDNYSDIEDVYGEYKNIKRISKIWLNSEGRTVDKKIPGLKVNFS
jgi:hypothetical protein